MRITPLEIRQKEFEKKLRGYDKDEVTAFLTSLSNEWERIVDEKKELSIKLEQSEKEVQKLREVENSLFKTLKTAEDTGANLIDQANKAAELHLKESQMNAEAILNEAKSKAKSIIEDAEQNAKEMIVEMQDAIKDLEENYKNIENQRDNLLIELKNLANDVLERASRPAKTKNVFKVEDHLTKVKKLVRQSQEVINKEQLSVSKRNLTNIPKASSDKEDTKAKLESFMKSKTQSKPKNERKASESSERGGKSTESFFDQIED